MAFVTEFKGYEIQVDKDGEFRAYQDSKIAFTADKLETLKNKINDAQKKTINKPALLKHGYSDNADFEDVTISSIVETPSRYGKNFDVWCIWETKSGGKQREKTDFRRVFKPTEGNRKIITELKELEKQENEIGKKMEKLNEKLEHFKPEDFGYKDE